MAEWVKANVSIQHWSAKNPGDQDWDTKTERHSMVERG